MDLKSVLVVFQNADPARLEEYADWYTNIHIRDAMRLKGAIATQRFVRSVEQPRIDGRPVEPDFRHLTLYEWESARDSIDGHLERAFGERMIVSNAGRLDDVFEFYYDPMILSAGWTRESGFRGPGDVIAARIAPRGNAAEFEEWFRTRHLPETLGLPGYVSAALLKTGAEQAIAKPCPSPYVAIYSLSDRGAAVEAWDARHERRDSTDLRAQAETILGCFEPIIPRLRAEEVLNPSADADRAEQRARQRIRPEQLWTRAEAAKLLF